MTNVTIVTGCAGTGKTARLLEDYRQALENARKHRQPGRTLWLTPNRRIQRAVLREIVAQQGTACFAPNVLTFDLFAEQILKAAGRPATPISPVMKRLMLRRIATRLKEAGELRHFRSIADTTGFLDVVSSFISEVKREEIWPEQFIAACQKRKSAFSRRDLELGLIYSDYQRHLAEHQWYDNEGRFWLARTALEEGTRGSYESVKCLVVDGFADFTQTQYEILGYLAGWIDQITISLPVEHPLQRNDLFSKPYAAISRIRKHLPDHCSFQVERYHSNVESSTPSSLLKNGDRHLASQQFVVDFHTPTEPVPVFQQAAIVRRTWTASVSTIADKLFANPRSIQPALDTSGLELIAATGQMGEWEAIARRIKTLLSTGTMIGSDYRSGTTATNAILPQDIIIGLRSISDDGPRLQDYLTSAGLPVWCETELTLTSSPIVKALMSLLNCELEDWAFERLLSVLDSNFFQPTWPEFRGGQAVRSVAAALRRLQIESGRLLILKVLGRYATESASESEVRSESITAVARLASPLLVKFSRCLDRLRRSHSLGDWADVLASVAEELGWRKDKDLALDESTSSDSRDLDLLQRLLRTAAEADEKLALTEQPPLLSLAKFASELRDLLSHETVHSSIEPTGCIRILSVEQIRNLEVPHLFLVGLTENSFPMNRADDCLFSEAERQEFIAHGVNLRHRLSQHADEMFLFYSIVTRARRSLTLSYPSVNSKGQPVFSSPYVTAITSLFESGSVKTSKEGQLDPVPQTERAMTLTDLRLAAIEEAREGRPGLFRSVLDLETVRNSCWNTLSACEVADYRFHQRGFTRFEGRLELSQNIDGLQKRFGSHHQFSATELEAYARCPFQFWNSTVLRIGPVESPEEGIDYAARGTLIHEVLAKLSSEGIGGNPIAIRDRFRELVDMELQRRVVETDFQQALIDVERQILFDWADAFARQEADYDQKIGEFLKTTQTLQPEIPFGSLPDAPATRSEAYPPIQFGNDENSVNLRGRIDRVDVGKFEGHPAYVVIDYKTGQRPSLKVDDLTSGRSIQLGLYLLAIKRLGLVGPEATPFQMGYWAVQESGFKHGFGKSRLAPIEQTQILWLENLLDHLLPQLAQEIRSGRFIVENQDINCTGRCPYRTTCRVNQIRPLSQSLGKSSPPRIDPSAVDDASN